jgi:thiol-disulfide isomerase/thioredoxin
MYSEYNTDKLSATHKNVLFFHASWCPACRWADKNFASSDIPQNVNLLKVDYDTSAELKEKYGVTMQHTFVLVDSEWEMIKKWSGSNDVKDLEMRAWE